MKNFDFEMEFANTRAKYPTVSVERAEQIYQYLMDEKEDICIEDLEKPVDDMELYCGCAGELKLNDPIMDMEIIGIVAINNLLCACVRKATKYHWEKYGNKRTCSKCNFSYFTGDDGFKYCPDCGAKMKEITNVSKAQ